MQLADRDRRLSEAANKASAGEQEQEEISDQMETLKNRLTEVQEDSEKKITDLEGRLEVALGKIFTKRTVVNFYFV